jgi:hypothetical protein
LSLLFVSAHGDYLEHNDSLRGRRYVDVQGQHYKRIVWIAE